MRDKSIKLITTFLVLLFLSSILNFSPTEIRKNENFQINTKENKPEASKFWNLPGISIDNNDSWANLALNFEWCSGSGNWSDPYIIQNVTIDGQNNSDYGIRIRNSDVYFKIINCTVYNVKYEDYSSGCTAITLSNVKNGFLINNSCSFNEIAIGLESCENLTIIGNNITNNDQWGLYIINSHNNTICNNNILDTYFTGIYLFSCKMNTFCNNSLKFNSQAFDLDNSNRTIISKNIIKDNRDMGLSLRGDDSSEMIISYNDVHNNIIENNSVGIDLGSGYNINICNNTIRKNRQDGMRITNIQNSHFCNNLIINNSNYGMFFYLDFVNNTIEKNIITNNTDGLYFYMKECNNTIFSNNIINNINDGIDIGGAGNILFLNNFSHNGNNAKGGGDNNWDNGSIGNYWDNYIGVDANDDGIGDTPYNITGSASNQDNYPIWWDTIVINIHSPNSNESFGITAPNFIISTSRGIAHTTWYTINNNLTKITFTGLTEKINQTLWDALPEGSIVIKFYANDSVGNIGFQEVTIVKEITQPSPSGISGYNLLFLLGIISVMVVLIIKKRINHLKYKLETF